MAVPAKSSSVAVYDIDGVALDLPDTGTEVEDEPDAVGAGVACSCPGAVVAVTPAISVGVAVARVEFCSAETVGEAIGVGLLINVGVGVVLGDGTGLGDTIGMPKME